MQNGFYKLLNSLENTKLRSAKAPTSLPPPPIGSQLKPKILFYIIPEYDFFFALMDRANKWRRRWV
jgi:hypothetical protein